MNSISADELFIGLVGHGLFPDKLPPIFTGLPFLKYISDKQGALNRRENHDWVRFRMKRDIGSFRELGIPNPFAHARLAFHLQTHWGRNAAAQPPHANGHNLVGRIECQYVFAHMLAHECDLSDCFANFRLYGFPAANARIMPKTRIRASHHTGGKTRLSLILHIHHIPLLWT